MTLLKFDGVITAAYWKARTERPGTWEEYILIPEIAELDLEAQEGIWRLLNAQQKREAGKTDESGGA